MKTKHTYLKFCLILFDFCCIAFSLVFACIFMMQRGEMKALEQLKRSEDSSLSYDIKDFLDEIEAKRAKLEETEEVYRELERKCNARICLEEADIDYDSKAYIEKLFSIRKGETYVESDWLSLIYEKDHDEPSGIYIQNQLSQVGVENIELGMTFAEIKKIIPESVEKQEWDNGTETRYLLIEDDEFCYYYIGAGGDDEAVELYIEWNRGQNYETQKEELDWEKNVLASHV